ncbi:RNA polymerase sigma factor [Kiloniella majae]|uniref:RNA polymerase sigma factor n=1 Tax=Kiloniella majae TaxID=1938558 RepID=UPI000A2783C4|nr:RNA polymerase sigma factor [Kiloniella majae]
MEAELSLLMPKLTSYAIYLTRNDDVASDLLQETYFRALLKKTSYNDKYDLEPWLKKIMRNIWIDQCRKRQLEVKVLSTNKNVNADNHYTIEENLEHRSLLKSIERSISELPERDRNVLYLILIHHLSYEEAAIHLSLPIGTVMSQYSRAKKRLKKKFKNRKKLNSLLMALSIEPINCECLFEKISRNQSNDDQQKTNEFINVTYYKFKPLHTEDKVHVKEQILINKNSEIQLINNNNYSDFFYLFNNNCDYASRHPTQYSQKYTHKSA